MPNEQTMRISYNFEGGQQEYEIPTALRIERPNEDSGLTEIAESFPRSAAGWTEDF